MAYELGEMSANLQNATFPFKLTVAMVFFRRSAGPALCVQCVWIYILYCRDRWHWSAAHNMKFIFILFFCYFSLKRLLYAITIIYLLHAIRYEIDLLQTIRYIYFFGSTFEVSSSYIFICLLLVFQLSFCIWPISVDKMVLNDLIDRAGCKSLDFKIMNVNKEFISEESLQLKNNCLFFFVCPYHKSELWCSRWLIR